MASREMPERIRLRETYSIEAGARWISESAHADATEYVLASRLAAAEAEVVRLREEIALACHAINHQGDEEHALLILIAACAQPRTEEGDNGE